MSGWERVLGAVGGAMTVGGGVLGLFGVSAFGLLESFAMFLAGFALFLGGLFMGWSARAWREHRGGESLRRRYEALDGERKRLLEWVYINGVAEVHWESGESKAYEGMSHMGFTAFAGGGLMYRWRLTEKCRKMMDGMRGL